MTYRYKYNRSLLTFAKKNKRVQTDAEKTLWYNLRNRQLLDYKFRRQYPIHNYILDFYCIESKLAIELDGSQHMQHETYDEQRDKVLKDLGIKTLRLWDNEVLQNKEGVLEKIISELEVQTDSTSS